MTASTEKTVSKGQKQAADVAALLRARNPLIWIVTREEARVETFLIEAAASASYVPRFWDVGAGVTKLDGEQDTNFQNTNDPGAVLTAIRNAADRKGAARERGVWVLRDMPVWLMGQPGAMPTRQLRNLARYLPGVAREGAQAIVLITPDANIPAELAGHVTVIDWSLPDRTEIAAILDAALNSLPEAIRANAAPNGTRDAAIDAAIGLTGEEAASCYAKSLVQTKKIDPAVVSQEKRRVIAREKVLEWHDPIKGGLDAVGGLGNLKDWLVKRKQAFSASARAYGLPAPKGVALVGISGCGKSLTAKAVATAWGVPLLRLDLNALKGKFMGDSENNLRKAFSVIEAIGRCVVWLDEIEKALAGATTSVGGDGGVAVDALGALLSWMQERNSRDGGGAFLVATANDVSSLPPELLRKGRFDDVFFVDLPNDDERVGVLKAALKEYGRQDVSFDFDALSEATDTFTGAEIAELVPTALHVGFEDGAREITTEDLLAAAKEVVPLSKSKAKVIEALREWGKTNARLASASKSAEQGSRGRKLDLDPAA